MAHPAISYSGFCSMRDYYGLLRIITKVIIKIMTRVITTPPEWATSSPKAPPPPTPILLQHQLSCFPDISSRALLNSCLEREWSIFVQEHNTMMWPGAEAEPLRSSDSSAPASRPMHLLHSFKLSKIIFQ